MKTLLQLIQEDPVYIDATNPTDAASLDNWLEPTVTVWINVPWVDYGKWLSDFDQAIKFKDGADIGSAETLEVRNACLLAIVPINSTGPLHTSDAQVRADLQKLVPTIISIPARDALLVLAKTTPQNWTNSDVDWTPGASERQRRLDDINRVRSA